MKKILAVLLSLCMLFCLVACGTNNTTSGDTTNNDVSQTETKNDFVVGEKLDNLTELPLSFPFIEDTKVNVQEINITKSEILNPNEVDDYIYEDTWGDYTFYRYKYLVTIKGNADTKFAEKYIRLKMHFFNGDMTVNTYFEGNLLKHMSGGYNSDTNKTELVGCVFKVQSDGSFTGEFTGYSNDNLNEFVITSIVKAH